MIGPFNAEIDNQSFDILRNNFEQLIQIYLNLYYPQKYNSLFILFQQSFILIPQLICCDYRQVSFGLCELFYKTYYSNHNNYNFNK